MKTRKIDLKMDRCEKEYSITNNNTNEGIKSEPSNVLANEKDVDSQTQVERRKKSVTVRPPRPLSMQNGLSTTVPTNFINPLDSQVTGRKY